MSLVKEFGSSVTVSTASGSVERDVKGGDVTDDESSRLSYGPKSVMSDLSGDFKVSRPSITTTLAPRPRKSNDLSDFTIDKLNIASLGLHGREMELKLLKTALNKLVSGESSEHERQLVLISGYSGTGKTALTNNAFKRSTEKLGGLFVRGKFDLNLRSQPYSGIAAACAEICGAIVKLKIHKLSMFEQLCSQIKAEVGSELSLLIQVIPTLTDVVDGDVAESPSTTHSPGQGERSQGGMSSAGSKHQFNFAFLRFIRAISYQFVPLVFVLDDLQWADGASLDLLDVLLTDPSSSKLMVVGIYRSNEVDETHIFHRTLADMEAKSQEKYFQITRVELGNIEFDAVHEIIRELLGMESDARTFGLADVCHRKTHGNVFFLLQFLSMLKERQFLQFNFGSLSWTWDNKEIESSTGASDNVVDLLKAKMTELPKDLADILKLASCLGSTFEVHTLNIVWERSTALALGDEQVLMTSLEVLEGHGYIVKRGEESTHQNYTWGHDKIQEGALSLIPETERGAFAAKVGRILLSHLDDHDLDSAIFVVVNLLNGADDKLLKDDKARLDLARLNYKAGCKAISLSAFESAAAYAAKGIRLLPENAWVNHYDLTLDVHTIGAQAEGFIGNTETMEQYCTSVLSQDRPMEDKFGVYYTWIDSLMNRGKLDEARDHLLEILKICKCRFPRNAALVGLGVVRNVIGIKSTMKSRDASKLVILSDTTRIKLMKVLDKLATVFYMLKDDRMPLAIFRSLNWTMKYGYCEYSSCTFATTGMMLNGILNDFQGGSKYGEQGLALMERSKSQDTAARTMFCVYAFLFPWTKLLRSLLKPLLQGYDIGLQSGDTESAMWSIYHWLVVKQLTGGSLESLEADALLYVKQMKGLKRDPAGGLTRCLRQAYLNLLGRDNVGNPTNFSGDSLGEADVERYLADSFLAPSVFYCQGMLFTYFGEHVRHADLAIKMGHDYVAKAHLCSPNIIWDTLFAGISCFVAARQTGKKKYFKMGQIFRSKVKNWIVQGNPNVKHYESLLDAEWAAFKGKKFDAIKHYEAAVLLAARGGFQHDAALATERLAEFHLTVMHDREEAAFQVVQSIRYWGDWGAIAKVRHLEEKYAVLVPQPNPT